MGAVCQAVHMLLGRKVVIKQLHPMFAQHTKAVQRFFEEVQNTALLETPHICEVIDIGYAENGAPYWVMSQLSGKSLDAVIKSEGRLPLTRAADIVIQALNALSSAHSLDIVHHDLKPDKIFVMDDYGKLNDFVKILDLGVFKTVYEEYLKNQSGSGIWMGTPCYMSPEQASGTRKIDSRANIYTMGAILYEALTGRKPYEGDDYNGILFKIVTQPFASPRSIVPEIPSAIEDVILKAMDRDPTCRYATAVQMQADLARAVRESEDGRPLPVIINSEFQETLESDASISERAVLEEADALKVDPGTQPDVRANKGRRSEYVVSDDDIEDSWDETDDFERTIRVDKFAQYASVPPIPARPAATQETASIPAPPTTKKVNSLGVVVAAATAAVLIVATTAVYVVMRINRYEAAPRDAAPAVSVEGTVEATPEAVAATPAAVAPPRDTTDSATAAIAAPTPISESAQNASKADEVEAVRAPPVEKIAPPATPAPKERRAAARTAPKDYADVLDSKEYQRESDRESYRYGKLGSKIGSTFE